MPLRRFALTLIAAGALGRFFLTSAPDADAASRGLKFWAAEYRVYYMPGEVDADGVLGPAKARLVIKGRASAYGGDKVDFKWTEPDAVRWLPILQVCGGGQGKLSGHISSQTDQTDDRGIEGSGPIDELDCRIILK